MKKFILMAAMSAFVLGFSSCNDDDNPEKAKNPTALVVRTGIHTRATISEFQKDAELGLFVTSGSLDNNYNFLSDNANVYSVYNGSYWEQSPVVYLNSAPATIYAYYPYNNSELEGKSVHVEHLTQKDYMYGTHSVGQNSINNLNPVVQLTMYHALALIEFQFDMSDYSGAGKVTKIGIMNAPGKKVLFSEGTMDISSGIITGLAGKNAAAITNDIEDNQNARLMVLPINISSTGDIVVQFAVDNKLYSWEVPAKTFWAGGTKNIYRVKVNEKKVTVGNVMIKDWETGTNELAYL